LIDPFWLELGALVAALLIFRGFYVWGQRSGRKLSKAEAEQENQSLRDSLNSTKETIEGLKSKVAELKSQLSEETERLEQLKATKDQEIANAIKTNKSELKAERTKLQTDFDKARQELEPKIRAEMEAKLEAEFKSKQEGIEAEFKARHKEEHETLWAFIGVALDEDERLIQLFKILPRTDTLAVLMKTKKDKVLLRDLQAAAALGQEHFIKEVEIKNQILSESSAGGEQPSGSTDNEILALLKKGPLGHGKIVKAVGKPKATVSDALSRLRDSGLVEQDPNTGDYYAS
jgi:DNA-binding transcriptional ArsR family regulator